MKFFNLITKKGKFKEYLESTLSKKAANAIATKQASMKESCSIGDDELEEKSTKSADMSRKDRGKDVKPGKVKKFSKDEIEAWAKENGMKLSKK